MVWRTYQSSPPIPEKVVTASGQIVFTGADVKAGQDVFLRYGLMEYGSISGHGAYLGPDFTADYLHRSADLVQQDYGGSGSDTAGKRTVEDFKSNRFDSASKTLTVSDAQAAAFGQLTRHYADTLGSPQGKTGLRPNAITDPTQIGQLTSYFAPCSRSASCSCTTPWTSATTTRAR